MGGRGRGRGKKNRQPPFCRMCQTQWPAHGFMRCHLLNCFNCGKPGHSKWNCDKIQCNRCLGFGHTARDCSSETPVGSAEVNTASKPGSTSIVPEPQNSGPAEGACGTGPAVARPRTTVFGSQPPRSFTSLFKSNSSARRGDEALPTTREAKVRRVLEEARSGCSTEKLQEKLDQLEADQKEAQTVMEYQISKAKHEFKIKLQSIELERAKVLEEFEEARKWAGIVASMERAVQDQLSESMEIDSDEGGAHASSTPAEEAREFLENQVDELTTKKPESEVTEPQPENTELTNSSTVVSPQIQNAEAAEPELVSAELSEPVVAVDLINSEFNSDVSAENTLDSQNSGIKKFGQKIKNKVIELFSKENEKEEEEEGDEAIDPAKDKLLDD